MDPLSLHIALLSFSPLLLPQGNDCCLRVKSSLIISVTRKEISGRMRVYQNFTKMRVTNCGHGFGLDKFCYDDISGHISLNFLRNYSLFSWFQFLKDSLEMKFL